MFGIVFGMALVWYGHCSSVSFGMMLVLFWHGLGKVLVWCWYGFAMDWYSLVMVLVLCWNFVSMALVWFWYGVGIVLVLVLVCHAVW